MEVDGFLEILDCLFIRDLNHINDSKASKTSQIVILDVQKLTDLFLKNLDTLTISYQSALTYSS